MFRAAMRAARGNDSGPSDTQQQIMEQMDDRTECKFCGRKFNEQAAERHIPLCEKKFKENQMKNKGGATAAKANRTGIGFKK